MSNTHDRNLAAAFDDQAARFERAPVQTDPALLDWLLKTADLPPGSRVLDVGCGPGIVSAGLLAAGHRVFGVDLSSEMVARARQRNASYEEKAEFAQRSVFDSSVPGPFDATISRFVLHHMADPLAFARRQAELLRPGGILVIADHTTDPDPDRRTWHNQIDRGRDRTHTHSLTPGQIVDLLAAAGLGQLRLHEKMYHLDFDEWFDRGTPDKPKEKIRELLLSGTGRGFRPIPSPDGRVSIEEWLAVVRGVKPQ